MKRSSHPLRIGLFVLAGIGLLVTAVVVVSGGRLFADTERGVLYFDGSVYGLQVGAPVVLRGVRVGSVLRIGLRHDEQRGGFLAPVQVSVDKAAIRDAEGRRRRDEATVTLAALVQRGLQGALATQSLLTGQQYVDLSIGQPRREPLPPNLPGEPVQIPTLPAGLGLQAQLNAIDVRGLVADLSAVAAAARQFVGTAELKQGLADFAHLAATLNRVSLALEQRIGPLVQGAQGVIADSRQAAQSLGRAADRIGVMAEGIGQTAGQLGRAATRAEALLAPDAPLPKSLQQAAEQVAQGAAALRQAAADDSQLMQGVDGTLAELRRTARAVRELAELLEQRPEVLIRGRQER
jgi:paraquat-inducible protein B